MLHEISRRSIHVSKNEEPILSWHNSVLTVRTERGIQFFDFSYNLQCFDKSIDLLVSFLPNTKSSPATELISNKRLIQSLNNMDLTQMIIDPRYWPHNEQLTEEMTTIVAFEWSPVGIIHNNGCLLAVVNNTGNVNLFCPGRCEWICAFDLSSIIKKHYDSSSILQNVNDFNKLKKAVDTVQSSAICWEPKFDNGSCYFVTSQRNGNILLWVIQCKENEVSAEFHGEVQTGIDEIFSMLWIPKTEARFLLICSTLIGQIYAFECKIEIKGIKLLTTTCLWTYKDRMIAKYLLHTVVDDKIILLCNKHRHLLVQMIDKHCNILSQIVNNVNDYRITDIKSSNDGFYLSTVNCKLYKINLILVDGNLSVNLSLVETKDAYSTYELYNFSFSTNNVIWALAMVDRKILRRKYPEKIELVFLCTDMQHGTEVDCLLNNVTKKLTNHWDCIELLRYKTMKLKILPPIDYGQLYGESNTNLYKLKLYFIFLILYNNLEKIIKNASRGKLPETSEEIVREKIYLSHASGLLIELHNTMTTNGQLNKFELETFVAATKYLECYCKKHKRNLNEFASLNALNLTKIDHTCQCCDEKLEGFSCKNGHMNMFCSLSFTPIESEDYLVCKSCNSTAKIELYRRNPMCLFCDLYLNNCYLPS